MDIFPLASIIMVYAGHFGGIDSISRYVSCPAMTIPSNGTDRGYILYSTLLACPFFVFVYPLLAVRRSFITSTFAAGSYLDMLTIRSCSGNTSVQLVQPPFIFATSTKECSACWSLYPGISSIHGVLLLLFSTELRSRSVLSYSVSPSTFER